MYSKKKYEHAPDWIDVDTAEASLFEEHSLVCRFELGIRDGYRFIICRCYKPDCINRHSVVCQASVRVPIKSNKDTAVMAFNALFDCHMQMDRATSSRDAVPAYGVASVPTRP